MEFDVVIIGAGPAGIQAGMHSSRKKASTMIIGKIDNSGMFGAHIENHFGAIGKADGAAMLKEGLAKARQFGCAVLDENVTSAARQDGRFVLTTESGNAITAKSVILASGISRNKLGVPGEKEFMGKGVSYCAACDANFYKGKRVAVVGDESEAAASAELMTKYASSTYWIAKDMDVSDHMIKKTEDAGAKIIRMALRSINGKDKVGSMTLADGSEIELDGVFIELGGRSSADLAMDLDIMPDISGLVKVDPECRTGAEGVFACGDMTGRPWQVAKAVGQGCIAGTNAADYAKGLSDVGQ